MKNALISLIGIVLATACGTQGPSLNYSLDDVRYAYVRACSNEHLYTQNTCRSFSLMRTKECVDSIEAKCVRRARQLYRSTDDDSADDVNGGSTGE